MISRPKEHRLTRPDGDLIGPELDEGLPHRRSEDGGICRSRSTTPDDVPPAADHHRKAPRRRLTKPSVAGATTDQPTPEQREAGGARGGPPEKKPPSGGTVESADLGPDGRVPQRATRKAAQGRPGTTVRWCLVRKAARMTPPGLPTSPRASKTTGSVGAWHQRRARRAEINPSSHHPAVAGISANSAFENAAG